MDTRGRPKSRARPANGGHPSSAIHHPSSNIGTVPAEVIRCHLGSRPTRRPDTLAQEEPLELRVRGRSLAVTMRTPGQDQELAAGFLFSEGVIKKREELVGMGPCLASDAPENTLNVFLAPRVKVAFARLSRHVLASASCGLCGKTSIEAVHQHFPPIDCNLTIPARTLTGLPSKMLAAQKNFSRTGGLHAAAIFDRQGRLIALREDIGRHNAVDKLLGFGLLHGRLPFSDSILLVSGRASFEIMQKALAGRIPVVCAISAASSLAMEFARESAQTLVGFLRGASMNLYSCPERIFTGSSLARTH
jgi:FdhD protein